MRHLFRFALLVALLVGCTKKVDLAPDPFVGHWQAERVIQSIVDASGQVVGTATTVPLEAQLDVTATTMRFTFGTGSAAVVGTPISYTRSGEVLTLSTSTVPGGSYARELTPASFTYEINNLRSDGSFVRMRYPYHR